MVFPMISKWMTEADERALVELYRREEAKFGVQFEVRCRALVDGMGAMLQSVGTE